MKLNSHDLVRLERSLDRQIRQNIAAAACDDTNLYAVILDIAQDVKTVMRLRSVMDENEVKRLASINVITQELHNLKKTLGDSHRTSTGEDYKECVRRAQQYGWQVDHICNIFMAVTRLKERRPSLPSQHKMFNLLIPVGQTALVDTELSRVTGITDQTFGSHGPDVCYRQMLAMLDAAPLHKKQNFDKTLGFDKSLYTPVCEWVTEYGTALVYSLIGAQPDRWNRYVITMVMDKGRAEFGMFFVSASVAPRAEYDVSSWKETMKCCGLDRHYLYFTKASDDGLLLQRVCRNDAGAYFIYESSDRAMPEVFRAYETPVHLDSHWNRTAPIVAAGTSVEEVYGLLNNL